MKCYALPIIMHLILQAGNFLNRGVSLGNAAGFQLSSLKKLTETKANRPGITLMHYVAMVSPPLVPEKHVRVAVSPMG